MSLQLSPTETLRKRLAKARRRGLKPPPKLNLVQWAESFRYLTAESSSVTGLWKTSTVEVARGPMLAITDPTVHTVTVMSCTQLLKTELLNNTVGFYIHQDPAPIILIQPTTKLGESWSKDRFDKMRRSSPILRKLVKDPRSRDSGNTIDHKEFPGGQLSIVGANSPVDLASRPIRVVLADEIDKYPPSAGKEGDPLYLAEERAGTFWNRKSVRACSPTTKGFSRIEREFLSGDRRKPFLACPHCDHLQVLSWQRVVWGRDEGDHSVPDGAEYHCESCGAGWAEMDRLRLLRTEGAVVWRQTKAFRCCGEEHTPAIWDHEGRSLCPKCQSRSPFDGHASFWASKLYSPWERLPRIVGKWLRAHKHPETRKAFVNTQLAEPFEEDAEKIDGHDLMSRLEDWGERAPDGVLVVTAGVDVQADRLEVERVGWGVDEESWSLDHHIIYGEPQAPQIWAELDEYLLTPTMRADGTELPVHSAAIDSGFYTQQVYSFCADRTRRKVWAVKGMDGGGRPVWPARASKVKRSRVNLFIVGVDTGKDAVYARLRLPRPGPGYCHFPSGRDYGYFDQLTAEVVKTKFSKGFATRVYELPSGKRNEALDCRVYAYAALQSLRVKWSRLLAAQSRPIPTKRLEPPGEVAPQRYDEAPAAASQAAVSASGSRPRRRRENWITGGRGNWLG